jgi:WXXGXW repeat (2 copies)
MFRKSFLSAALGVFLAIGAANAAEVVVRVGPPAPIVETRVAAPGPGYVWTPGYHRWDGNRHVWVAGSWVQPPRPHAHWVAHHWVRRNGGWVLVEGHWR